MRYTHTVIVGPDNCGKTRALTQILNGRTAHGIWTEKCAADDKGVAPVYLHPYGAKPQYSTENCIGFCQNSHSIAYPKVFDTVGVALLSNIKPDEIIVIDEVGVMERKALRYQETLLALMSKGENPIILVCRDKKDNFIEKILNHPLVAKRVVCKK